MAGQIRTVAIAKGVTFCLPQYIESSATVIFTELRDEHFGFAWRMTCPLASRRCGVFTR